MIKRSKYITLKTNLVYVIYILNVIQQSLIALYKLIQMKKVYKYVTNFLTNVSKVYLAVKKTVESSNMPIKILLKVRGHIWRSKIPIQLN